MIHPRRHGLYYHDEHIQVFIPGIDREETVFVPRTDKVISMRLEAVPLGFQVPHPLRLSSEEGTLTAREGVEQGFPTAKHRSKEGDLGLTRDLRPRGKPPGSLVKIPCQDQADQGPTKKKKNKGKTRRKEGSSSSESDTRPIPSKDIPSSSASLPAHSAPAPAPTKLRVLDLFSGTGSTAEAFREQGFEVVTLDFNPKFRPDICVDILEWDYAKAFKPGYFHTIAVSPPCTEYSAAMTCRPRELAKADAIVERALKVIEYLQPWHWFIENPRTGMLKDRGILDGVTYVDVDYCQFCDWGYQKPTRIWGPPFLENLRPKVCDWRECPNLMRRSNGYLGHKRTLGATPRDGAPRIPLEDQYRIPKGVISYIFGWDRKDSDWKVPLTFKPPDYPPPPLPACQTEPRESQSANPAAAARTVTSNSKTPVQPKVQRKQESEWLPASAHNARGKRGNAFIRLTSTEETDSVRTRVSLPMGYPKRRKNKANVYTPYTHVEETGSQTSSSIFRPESTKSSIPKPSRISDPSSLYDLSSTVESDLVSESTLVSTPGTSTELEIKQDAAEGKVYTQRGKQSYGWMELSEGESDAESELGEEDEIGILPPKYMARERRIQRLRSLNLHLPGRTHQEGQSLSEKELEYIDDRIRQKGGKSVRKIGMVKGAIEARDPYETPAVEKARKRLLEGYAGSVFQTRVGGDHPIRGPHGEAEIILKKDAVPVKQRMFQIQGERKAAWVKLTDEIIEDGKIEPGVSPWSSPSFPVPKKKPGEYRLVEDFRKLNDATVDDGHPLPRIEDILQKQGGFKIWSVLDLKDGYHQMPLKEEHRPYTCMSTPRGSFQWKVLVMGLKNGNAMFQRMMEWVLRDLENADPYVDDIIIGSTGANMEEIVANHEKDVKAVLDVLREHKLIVDPKKASMFMGEVEFCGHILREGRRSPAPGKLLSIQKWELPGTVTALRGFLGLTNYYSSYVHNYAGLAAPLMDKLQVGRLDGKKGSLKPVAWDDRSRAAFESLKDALKEGLQVFQLEPDQPFVLRTDASDFAIGAVLEQERNGEWVPVSFFSRKLGQSQLNWTPREKETYAIVASLRKWAGWVGFQPVLVKTDHRSLENWVSENIDTPSGPRGRRARWHETLSQFNLEVQYIPGKDNTVADAMSRFAYPASSSREDVSFHGSARADAEVRKLIEQEIAEGNMIGMIRLGRTTTRGSLLDGYLRTIAAGEFIIVDPQFPARPVAYTQPVACQIPVVTRTGKDTETGNNEPSVPQEEDVPMDSPPPAHRTRSRAPPPGRNAAPLPPQSRRSTRGRRRLRATVPWHSDRSDSSSSPPPPVHRRSPRFQTPGPGISGTGAETRELSGQGSIKPGRISANAETLPANSSKGPSPSSIRPPGDPREVPAGTSLEASGQGREEPVTRREKSGQGSATAGNPSGLFGQGSAPIVDKLPVRFAFKRPVQADHTQSQSPASEPRESLPRIVEEAIPRTSEEPKSQVSPSGDTIPPIQEDRGSSDISPLTDIEMDGSPPRVSIQEEPNVNLSDGEEVFYDCISHSSMEVDNEATVSNPPKSPRATDEPKELVWGLSKDEWATVMVEGVSPLEGNIIELWEDREMVEDCEIRVYFDVPLVFLELDLRRASTGLIHLVAPCTQSVISIRYLVKAENVQSGRIVWERDPSPRNLNEKFYFQSQLPADQRADNPTQTQKALSSRREVLKPTSVLDEDWTSGYENSETWGPIMEQIGAASTAADPDAEWPDGLPICPGKSLPFGETLCSRRVHQGNDPGVSFPQWTHGGGKVDQRTKGEI
jgi:hypothetical protein